MSTTTLVEVCPNFLPHVILCAGAIVLATSVSVGRTEWWNTNIGFNNNKWIFSLTTLLVMGFILTVVYMFLWYKCLCVCRTGKANLLFGVCFALFFCSYIMLFLYNDKKIALCLAIVTLIILLYLTCYVFYYATMLLGFVLLAITLFVGHFVYQVNCVKI